MAQTITYPLIIHRSSALLDFTGPAQTAEGYTMVFDVKFFRVCNLTADVGKIIVHIDNLFAFFTYEVVMVVAVMVVA